MTVTDITIEILSDIRDAVRAGTKTEAAIADLRVRVETLEAKVDGRTP